MYDVVTDEGLTLRTGKKKKYFNCCSRNGLILTIFFCAAILCCLLVILILLGVAVFLLYPRIPEASIENVEQDTFTLTGLPAPAINLFFTFDVVMDNDNYYDINIVSVNFDLNYQGADLGNFTLQCCNVTVLHKQSVNQTIPMSGSVSSANQNTILALISEYTSDGVDNFVLNGTLVLDTSFIPNMALYLETEVKFTPTILPPVGSRKIDYSHDFNTIQQ